MQRLKERRKRCVHDGEDGGSERDVGIGCGCGGEGNLVVILGLFEL